MSHKTLAVLYALATTGVVWLGSYILGVLVPLQAWYHFPTFLTGAVITVLLFVRCIYHVERS